MIGGPAVVKRIWRSDYIMQDKTQRLHIWAGMRISCVDLLLIFLATKQPC